MSEFYMSGRSNREEYGMRGTDWVEEYTRMINGTEYEFSRVTWGDGAVTVRAWIVGGSAYYPIHQWGRQVS